MTVAYSPWPISDEFVCSPECLVCHGVGTVCENHPDAPWRGMTGEYDGTECCGGAGMPCPNIAIVRAAQRGR